MQAIFGVFKRLSKPSKITNALTKAKCPTVRTTDPTLKPTEPLKDSFQRPLRPPTHAPLGHLKPTNLTQPAGDPSLNSELNTKIQALFGPSRRVPLKPKDASTI